MNKKGIIPITERTKDEAREISRKGGIASGKSRRLKKSMRDVAIALLEGKIKIDKLPSDLSQVARLLPDKDSKKLQYQSLVIMGQLRAAIGGDSRAAKFIVDILGESTQQDAELSKLDKLLTEFNKGI